MLFFIVIAIFVVVGCFVAFLLSTLGGWRRLAKQYQASQQPPGETLRFRSLAVGFVSYGNIVTVCISAEGLYLALFGPFRLMHPPLLIPWNEFTGVKEKQLPMRRTYRFSIGSPEWASLTLPEKLMNEIKTHRDALQAT